MKTKYLVTSGCSFSDNLGLRWPHYLAKSSNLTLYNRGQGSCGNDWISKTVIYQAYELMRQCVNPEEILIVVMWSGIDRKSLFVNKEHSVEFDNLNNVDSWNMNRISILDSEPNKVAKSNNFEGYIVGSSGCKFKNNNINKYKRECIMKYYPDESLAIESYENFLRLQWFCSSYNIKLYNLTTWNIMIYPNSFIRPNSTVLTKDRFKNIDHLYNMIDFNKWIFWKDYGGIYEYTVDNSLSFYADKVHPSIESHKHYVDNYLLERIQIS